MRWLLSAAKRDGHIKRYGMNTQTAEEREFVRHVVKNLGQRGGIQNFAQEHAYQEGDM